MRFNDNEYIVSKNVPDESITIVKEALEKWKDHYIEVATKYLDKKPVSEYHYGLYIGKASVLIDLLKHFEEEDV